MNIELEQIDNSTDTQIICDADINPILNLIIGKPLKNLFDYMADRLVKVKETS